MPKWKKRKKLPGYRNWTHWKDSKKDDPANPGLSRQWLVKTVFNKHCTCFRMRAGETQSGRLGQMRSVPVVSLVGECYQRKKGMQADLPGFLFSANIAGPGYVLARHADWAHADFFGS